MTPEENLYSSQYTPTIIIPFLFIALCIIIRRARQRNIMEVHLPGPEAETETTQLTWQYNSRQSEQINIEMMDYSNENFSRNTTRAVNK